MKDTAKVHRRVASQSRWSYQEQGARLLEETSRLKDYQRRCTALLNDLDGMTREQSAWQETGYFDGAQREGVLRLLSEVHEALAQWQAAAQDQEGVVKQCRLDLARAKQRKDKSEEMYQAALLVLRDTQRAFETKELDDIYINSYRHRFRPTLQQGER